MSADDFDSYWYKCRSEFKMNRMSNTLQGLGYEVYGTDEHQEATGEVYTRTTVFGNAKSYAKTAKVFEYEFRRYHDKFQNIDQIQAYTNSFMNSRKNRDRLRPYILPCLAFAVVFLILMLMFSPVVWTVLFSIFLALGVLDFVLYIVYVVKTSQDYTKAKDFVDQNRL